MSRPTKLLVEPSALLHNLARIKAYAPGKQIFAMVKANGYGCGVDCVAPVLDGLVDGFGVACLEEALVIKALGCQTQCILFQGVFSADEWFIVAEQRFACVLHHWKQLHWLVNTPLPNSVQIWVKVDTGMHRLGFKIDEIPLVMKTLKACAWVNSSIGLMTHLACADEPDRPENECQLSVFNSISLPGFAKRSIANSASIIAFPQTHTDAIRPGIMLYGVSPFKEQTGKELGLVPVMRFMSVITAINHYPPQSQIGYGGIWQSDKASVIGLVPVGYGDGYPRHIEENTPVWIKGREVPIVGRISMDMLTVDLTAHPDVSLGEPVELWGLHLPVERIAKSAGTIAYELLCQISERVRHRYG